MTANEAVVWARKVADRGWPRTDAPKAERIEAYEELAIAYGVLAEQAEKAGDTDNYLAFSDLAEHAAQFARKLRGPEDHRW
jgi:hypothetical protein